MIYQNHIVDPTFFNDAIEEFAFNYNLYVFVKSEIDDYGKQVRKYDKKIIRGSLQSHGKSLNQSKSGTTNSHTYRFYCRSLYRIDIGDILEYKNNYLQVDSVQDYDEYGVRECSLTMIQLSSYTDLADYIKYLRGEKLV